MMLWKRCIVCLAIVLISGVAAANPIPSPLPANMPLEDMYSTLDEIDVGGLRETFRGDYYFSYIPDDPAMMMKYPVPPQTDAISVAVGKLPDDWQFTPSIFPYIHEMQLPKDPVPWNWIFETYPTVVPEWPGIPMIAWNGPFPNKALYSVKYQHNLLQRGRDYIYFYALGTGKYYETYQKQAISFLDISMPVQYNMLRLFLDRTPHAFATTTELDAQGRKRTIVSVFAAAQFGPFTKDIIGQIRPWYVAADVNFDDKTDILDLIKVRNMLGRNPASDAAAEDADVNGDGRIDVRDLILLRNHIGEKPDVAADSAAGLAPQIRLRYVVKQCGSTQPPGITPDVTLWGNKMIVTDQIIFNCCKEYVRMTIMVSGNQVIFREKAMESAPCDCICYYPMKGTAGPFAPGTYQVQLIDPHGKVIVDKQLCIPSPD